MNIILSNTSKTPIYEQLESQITEEILKSNLLEGEQLPSIRSLAKDLGISVITVKHAYDRLEQNGYIYTIGGKGSYVSGQSVERLREKLLQIAESKLYETIAELKKLGISKEEVGSILSLLWESE